MSRVDKVRADIAQAYGGDFGREHRDLELALRVVEAANALRNNDTHPGRLWLALDAFEQAP